MEKIGSGGMAEIFKAVTRGAGDFQKVVVIKRILLGYSRDAEFVKMFTEEARITAPLQHANIVSIYEFDKVDEQYYLAMELVNGRDLQRVMARANKLQRSIPDEIVLYIVSEICKALWYAYNARDAYGNDLKIIHRDVSPSNILISYEGEVKVTDFGVAKAATSSGGETGGGVLKGKLGYMSPEQVLGRELDHRSDIFALGVILFEALTLKRMFLGRTDLQTLINIRDADVEKRLSRHPEIELGVGEILKKAMAKDPVKRYRNAIEFQTDIQDLLFGKQLRVGQGELAAFMKVLFPEEAELEIMPLEAEEISRGPGRRVSSFTLRQPQIVEVKKDIPDEEDIVDELLEGNVNSFEPVDCADVESSESAAFEVGGDSMQGGGETPSVHVEMSNDEGFVFPEADGRDGEEMLPIDEPSSVAVATRSAKFDPSQAQFRFRNSEGSIFGPVSFDNVLSLLKSRSISEDEACSINDGEWLRVGDIAVLRETIVETQTANRRQVLLFEGTIERRNTVGLITNIARVKRLTGLLTLKHGSNQKDVYFREGSPRYVFSNLRKELFGEFLVANQLVTRGQLEQAIDWSQRNGDRLGDSLIKVGAIGAHRLADALVRQFHERILEVFEWDVGWYGFFERAASPKNALASDIDAMDAVSEAVRTRLPPALVKAWMAENAGRRLARTERSKVTLTDLRLTPRETRVINLVDSNPSISEILGVMPNTPENEAVVYGVVFLLIETGVYQFKGMTREFPSIR